LLDMVRVARLLDTVAAVVANGWQTAILTPPSGIP